MKSGLETRDEGQEEMEDFKNRTRMTQIFKRGFKRIFFIRILFFNPPTTDYRPPTNLPRRGFMRVTVGQRSATYG
jgi:hypothetical protein